jgi:hypothetical protein
MEYEDTRSMFSRLVGILSIIAGILVRSIPNHPVHARDDAVRPE